MFNLLWTFIIGVVTGYLARLALPGHDHIGFWMTGLVGVAGSFGGHWIAKKMGLLSGEKTLGRTKSALISVGGAVALLLLLRLVYR